MVTAKCTRCLGSATGNSFDEASSKINHAVARSRGIKCGDNFNCVVEEKSETSSKKVEEKSADKVVLDESKSTTVKKSKKQY